MSANAQVVETGACGDGLEYTISGTVPDLTLTISYTGEAGTTGEMYDFIWDGTICDAPWWSQKADIKTLVINSGVTSIGNYAFYDCSGFTGDLIIPNSVTSIGDYAFYYCSEFTGTLTIGNSVQIIGNFAFDSCQNFTGNLIIPNSVTLIGNYAFANCISFNDNLTIGSSVQTIGDYAFGNCGSLTEINALSSTPPTLGTDVFDYVSPTIAVYVPCASLAVYPMASGWDYFSNYQCPLTFPDDAAYDIPASTVGIAITNIDVSGGVSGGTTPYTFSALGFPAGITINSTTGIISGTPTTATPADTATITVTDDALATASITIAYGAVTVPDIFEISLTATIGGIVSGSGTYQAGTQHTVTASANSGYTFINWIENGQVVSQAANYSFTVTDNRTLIAVFQETETDISDIDVPDDVDIMVVPDSISARIVWRANEDATGYILIIYGDANHTNIVCYLEFDANGRLTGITFGKSSENKTDGGIFAIRINNLTENATYFYTIETIGENDEIIDSKTGNFTTTSNTVGINNNETSKTNYIVFPNPTSGQLRITNYESSNVEIGIYDISGRVVFTTNVETHTTSLQSDGNITTLDISYLPAGIYFLRIGNETVKIVKQ
jgi:hypothetical protein